MLELCDSSLGISRLIAESEGVPSLELQSFASDIPDQDDLGSDADMPFEVEMYVLVYL